MSLKSVYFLNGVQNLSSPNHFEETLSYYNKHAEEFVNSTAFLDLSPLWKKFLEKVPPKARILDIGCGSGRDSLYFQRKGYQVMAIDASEQMVALAKKSGVDAYHMDVCNIEMDKKFDGIWCCASLLHVSKKELPDIFNRLDKLLNPQGVIYASFKDGEGEKQEKGRWFTFFTENSLKDMLSSCSMAKRFWMKFWHTTDIRPEKEGIWLNVLLQAK